MLHVWFDEICSTIVLIDKFLNDHKGIMHVQLGYTIVSGF